MLGWAFRPDNVDADEYAVYDALCGPSALVCTEVEAFDGRPAAILTPSRCKFPLLTSSELEHWFGSGRDEAAWERFRQAHSGYAKISRVRFTDERTHARLRITGYTGPVEGPSFDVKLSRDEAGHWEIEDSNQKEF